MAAGRISIDQACFGCLEILLGIFDPGASAANFVSRVLDSRTGRLKRRLRLLQVRYRLRKAGALGRTGLIGGG
jgi:hypothetical protein